jgi:hypothetical protein
LTNNLILLLVLWDVTKVFLGSEPNLSQSKSNSPPKPGRASDLQEFTYVDKTMFLARLLNPQLQPAPCILAPGMRRVGKSTTVKWLAEMVKGNIALFEGYQVNSDESPFKIGKEKLELIYLDFSLLEIPEDATKVTFQPLIIDHLIQTAMKDRITLEGYKISKLIENWVLQLNPTGSKRVVLLIDEYDAPITHFLPHRSDLAQSMSLIFKPFYSMIKYLEEHFRLVFVTGVSKFSSASMFSGANNFIHLFEDRADFTTLFGFTENEIRNTYGPHIHYNGGFDIEEVIDNLRWWYNGYRIHPEQTKTLYNPWSVIQFLNTWKYNEVWTKSATSSKVIEMLGLHGFEILNGFSITSRELYAPISATEFSIHWKQTAFQAGYATILSSAITKEEPEVFDLKMGVPNHEIFQFLSHGMVEYLAGMVDKNLYNQYAKSLFLLDFNSARDHLETLLSRLQDHQLPTNEDQFLGYVVHLLRLYTKDDRYLDSSQDKVKFTAVYTQVGARLIGDKRIGRTMEADGVILFFSGEKWRLLVIEAKYNEVGPQVALDQIRNNRYVERAFEYLETRNISNFYQHLCVVYKIGINLTGDNKVQLEVVSKEDMHID